jgi:hypothetical protein
MNPQTRTVWRDALFVLSETPWPRDFISRQRDRGCAMYAEGSEVVLVSRGALPAPDAVLLRHWAREIHALLVAEQGDSCDLA